MEDDLQQIIQKNLAASKRRNRLSLLVTFIVVIITVGVFYLTVDLNKKKEEKEILLENQKTFFNAIQESKQVNTLPVDTISSTKNDLVECYAQDLNEKLPSGKDKWRFTFQFKDSVFTKDLSAVEYYFNHPSFKENNNVRSGDSNNYFSYSYDGWGCLPNVEIFIHHRDNLHTDTLNFAMCDKLIIK